MKPTDADVKKIHEELICVDGAAPMVSWGVDPPGNIADSSGKARPTSPRFGAATGCAS